MSVPYYGDFAEDDTVLIPFNTFSSDAPSASITIGELADSDIKVHKDGSTDEIATDGASVAIDFDSRTGAHLITIDTSAHSDYATGSEYAVLIEGTTVDEATITAWIGSFSIERAGGVLAILKAGTTDVNVKTISNDAITPASVDEDADFVIQALSVTNALDAGSVLVDGTTTLTGNVSMGGTFDVVGAASAASVSIDAGVDVVGALSANSLLIDTTTTLTGNVSLGGTFGITGAATLASLSITGQMDMNNLLIDADAVITTNATISGNLLVSGTTTHTGAVALTNGINAGAVSGTLAADLITASSLKADACTKIIDDFETQSQADPTGFHVNVKEVNGTAQTANDNGADINEILTDTGTTLENRLIAIEADTNELQTDNIPGTLSTIAGYLDTEIASIKAVTDALTAAAAAKLALSAGSIVTGTVSWDNTNATTTVIYCDDITEATADHLNGRQMIFTSGDLKDQATDIEDYALDTGEGKFTVTALTEAPADNVTFIIV